MTQPREQEQRQPSRQLATVRDTEGRPEAKRPLGDLEQGACRLLEAIVPGAQRVH